MSERQPNRPPPRPAPVPGAEPAAGQDDIGPPSRAAPPHPTRGAPVPGGRGAPPSPRGRGRIIIRGRGTRGPPPSPMGPKPPKPAPTPKDFGIVDPLEGNDPETEKAEVVAATVEAVESAVPEAEKIPEKGATESSVVEPTEAQAAVEDAPAESVAEDKSGEGVKVEDAAKEEPKSETTPVVVTPEPAAAPVSASPTPQKPKVAKKISLVGKKLKDKEKKKDKDITKVLKVDSTETIGNCIKNFAKVMKLPGSPDDYDVRFEGEILARESRVEETSLKEKSQLFFEPRAKEEEVEKKEEAPVAEVAAAVTPDGANAEPIAMDLAAAIAEVAAESAAEVAKPAEGDAVASLVPEEESTAEAAEGAVAGEAATEVEGAVAGEAATELEGAVAGEAATELEGASAESTGPAEPATEGEPTVVTEHATEGEPAVAEPAEGEHVAEEPVEGETAAAVEAGAATTETETAASPAAAAEPQETPAERKKREKERKEREKKEKERKAKELKEKKLKEKEEKKAEAERLAREKKEAAERLAKEKGAEAEKAAKEKAGEIAKLKERLREKQAEKDRMEKLEFEKRKKETEAEGVPVDGAAAETGPASTEVEKPGAGEGDETKPAEASSEGQENPVVEQPLDAEVEGKTEEQAEKSTEVAEEAEAVSEDKTEEAVEEKSEEKPEETEKAGEATEKPEETEKAGEATEKPEEKTETTADEKEGGKAEEAAEEAAPELTPEEIEQKRLEEEEKKKELQRQALAKAGLRADLLDGAGEIEEQKLPFIMLIVSFQAPGTEEGGPVQEKFVRFERVMDVKAAKLKALGEFNVDEDQDKNYQLFIPYESGVSGLWLEDEKQLTSYGLDDKDHVHLVSIERKEMLIAKQAMKSEAGKEKDGAEIELVVSHKPQGGQEETKILKVRQNLPVHDAKVRICEDFGLPTSKDDLKHLALFKAYPGCDTGEGMWLDEENFVGDCLIQHGDKIDLTWPRYIGISSEKIRHKGWMTKSGGSGKIIKSWKYRFFVLRGETLSYFEKEDDKQPLGVIELKHISDLKSSEIADRKFFLWVKQPKERKYIMYPNTEEERTEWLKAIQLQALNVLIPTPVNLRAFVSKCDLLLRKDINGRTFLFNQITQMNENLVCALSPYLDQFVNIRDKKGQTLLHMASARAQTKIVRWLLKYNAAMIADNNKKVPTDLAYEGDHVPTLAVLLAHDLDHAYSFVKSYPDVFTRFPDLTISDYGFDINATHPKSGKTLLERAIEEKDDDVEAVLRAAGMLTAEDKEDLRSKEAERLEQDRKEEEQLKMEAAMQYEDPMQNVADAGDEGGEQEEDISPEEEERRKREWEEYATAYAKYMEAQGLEYDPENIEELAMQGYYEESEDPDRSNSV